MGLKARKPTWKQRAVKALTESIAHWKRMSDGKARPGEGPWAENCACCKTFMRDRRCGNCPVALRTGQGGCGGTPYFAASDAVLDGANDRRAQCQAEVDFLIETRDLVRKGKVRAPEGL